jgi:ATP-binding cassette, subfamily B, multidrug efflux pump
MKVIIRLIKPYWKHLTLSLSFKSIGALADLFLPWVIAYMIDETIPKLRLETDPNLMELYLLRWTDGNHCFIGLDIKCSCQ